MTSGYRDKCLRERGEECWICGDDEYVVVHHKNADKSDNRIENLYPVCHSCHASIHNGSDGYEEWSEALPDSSRGDLAQRIQQKQVDYDISGSFKLSAQAEDGDVSYKWEAKDASIKAWEKDGMTEITVVVERQEEANE